jgi:hypothetical protein
MFARAISDLYCGDTDPVNPAPGLLIMRLLP